jgi:molybdenum cofactor cytidylyltransferase
MSINKTTFHLDKPIRKGKIVGIILAAGGANRLGKPKQILEWNGEPLIRHVIRNVLKSNLQSYYVVTGAYRNQVVNVIKDLPITIIFNPNWKDGQSTSVKAGIRAIHEDIEAVIFILADQPFVDKSIINALIDAYKQTKKSIIIPTVNHQNTNPVLFARTTFPELLNLSGDTGGRKLFRSFDTFLLSWTDEKLIFDIDTIEDYKQLTKIQSEILEE